LEGLNALNPQTLAIVGVLWILREVFGFVKNHRTEQTEAQVILGALNRVADHIAAQTELIQGFVSTMRIMEIQIGRIEDQIDKVRDQRCLKHPLV
jgi:hypothetical protein